MKKVKVTLTNKGNDKKVTCWLKEVSGTTLVGKGGNVFSGDFLRDGEALPIVGRMFLHLEAIGSWKSKKKLVFIGIIEENGEIDWREIEGLNCGKKRVTMAEICRKVMKGKK